MKLTKEKRDKLRQVAEAAKRAAGGGAWTRWNSHSQVGILNKPSRDRRNDPAVYSGNSFIRCEDNNMDEDTPKANRIARHVAAADPDTVLALLDALDAAESVPSL